MKRTNLNSTSSWTWAKSTKAKWSYQWESIAGKLRLQCFIQPSHNLNILRYAKKNHFSREKLTEKLMGGGKNTQQPNRNVTFPMAFAVQIWVFRTMGCVLTPEGSCGGVLCTTIRLWFMILECINIILLANIKAVGEKHWLIWTVWAWKCWMLCRNWWSRVGYCAEGGSRLSGTCGVAAYLLPHHQCTRLLSCFRQCCCWQLWQASVPFLLNILRIS